MRPRGPGRAKGTCVVHCNKCSRRLAGKRGTTVKCTGCGHSQTVSRVTAPRKKIHMYL